MRRSQSHFTSEDKLILLLARGRLSPQGQDEARALLEGQVDWDQLVTRVIEQEVYPLFYSNLEKIGFYGVPERPQAELRSLYKINGFRNVRLAEELKLLLKLFADARIPVIPLKGMALAESLYGDI